MCVHVYAYVYAFAHSTLRQPWGVSMLCRPDMEVLVPDVAEMLLSSCAGNHQEHPGVVVHVLLGIGFVAMSAMLVFFPFSHAPTLNNHYKMGPRLGALVEGRSHWLWDSC